MAAVAGGAIFQDISRHPGGAAGVWRLESFSALPLVGGFAEMRNGRPRDVWGAGGRSAPPATSDWPAGLACGRPAGHVGRLTDEQLPCDFLRRGAYALAGVVSSSLDRDADRVRPEPARHFERDHC